MTKIAESLEAVYIYIYIEGFNKINLCKHRKKLCFLDESKMSNWHGFFVCLKKFMQKIFCRGRS